MRAMRRLASSAAHDGWKAVAAKEAAKSKTTLEALSTTTPEGLEIQPCYFGDGARAARRIRHEVREPPRPRPTMERVRPRR